MNEKYFSLQFLRTALVKEVGTRRERNKDWKIKRFYLKLWKKGKITLD